MSKTARTHDISLIDYHVTDVETLSKVLNDAIAAACPMSCGTRYQEVYVLLLSWEDDDIGVDSEVAALEQVFRDLYGFDTGRWKIPSRMSHNALVSRLLSSLIQFESDDKLFITYYGGHGYMNEDRQCVWLCNQQPRAATVQWSSIQTMLEEAACDVLVLLDCCAAASSGGHAGNGVTEVIAACGFEAFAPGVGQHSFTSNLTQELQYLGQSKPVFTTVFLHNKVLNRLKKSWNPRFAPSEQQERRRTPIYIHLGDDRKQRCIELGPPRRLASHTYAATPGLRSEPSADSSAPSTSQSETEDIDMLGLEDISQSSVGSNGQDLTSPQVLISVALEDEQVLHSRDWLDWLKEFPAIARSVHIEGVYKSDSTLLHLSLPVAIWDAIPRNPAISFLAFIRTNNLVRFRESRDLPSHTAQTRSHSHSGAIKAADGLQSLLVINRATIEVITAALIPFTAANDPLSGLSQYLNRSSQWAFASAYNPTGWWTGVSINANCTAALVFDLGPSQDKTASKSLPYSTSFTDPAPYQSSSKDGGWPKIKCPFERAESHPSPRCTAEFVSFVELYEHLFKVHSNVKQRPKRIQRVSNVEKMGSRAGDIQRD